MTLTRLRRLVSLLIEGGICKLSPKAKSLQHSVRVTRQRVGGHVGRNVCSAHGASWLMRSRECCSLTLKNPPRGRPRRRHFVLHAILAGFPSILLLHE